MRTIQLTLTGKGPALQHNGRLANPLDPYTIELASIVGKRKKTRDDLARGAHLETRASMYETPDGLIGWPTANVWRCMYDAAKAYKLGVAVKQAVLYNAVVEPIMLNGAHVKADTFLDDHPDGMFYSSVKVGMSRVMRARPKLDGWVSVHTFDLLDDVLALSNLEPVFERMGYVIGLGDWRPMYGKFDAELAE